MPPFNAQAFWSRKGLLNFLLLPLSLLFAVAVALRRRAYRAGLLHSGHPGVTVIVVGNLTAGGSGKTPFVIWLVEWLKSRGRHPGVVSRGYGRTDKGLRCVTVGSTAAEVGDEPLLVHARTGAPVAVGADRLETARLLRMRYPEVDVIVADDGLQHYRLQRDLELVLADAGSLFGNGWLLPAGPLREPISRLNEAEALILSQRGDAAAGVAAPVPVPVFRVRHEAAGFRNLKSGALANSAPQAPGGEIQAIAGIARPEGFFALLKNLGVAHVSRAFPDHHLFAASDIEQDATVIMTEKDAVKCRGFTGADWWALELATVADSSLGDWLEERLAKGCERPATS